MAHQLIISNTVIPFDSDNRINLNSLHRASKLGKSKQPNNWLRLDSTKELIKEFEQSSDLRTGVISRVRGGKTPGTFAHELLAISYAGWISPKFQLEVNRVFLKSRTAKPLPKLEHKIDKTVSLQDLIYEIAQLRGVSTEQVRIHYSHVFNTSNWTHESDAMTEPAKIHLREELKKELLAATPEIVALRQQAKHYGYKLVIENDLLAMQGRMQMQQKQIDNSIDELMGIARNNRQLSISKLWG